MEQYNNKLDLERLEGELFKHPLLPKKNEVSLLELIAQGNEEAVHDLVRHNIRNVGEIAAKYVPRRRNIGLFFDLVQEGIIALYDAARTYDLKYGEKRGSKQASFGTHSGAVIKRRIRQFLDNTRSACHVPRSGYTEAFKVATRKMRQSGIDVNMDTFYQFIKNPHNGINARRMKLLHKMPPEIVRAYFTIETASTLRFGSTAKDKSGNASSFNPTHYTPDMRQPQQRSIDDTEIIERVRAAVASLNPRQREVITLKYLGAGMNHREIGAITGVSHQAMSQQEANAMKELREALKDIEHLVA